MPESICPFCGKKNPENVEFCQSCKARLVPGSASASEDDAASHDVSEWLKRTSPDLPASKPVKPIDDNTKKGQEETPDWLERIRERSRLEQEDTQGKESVIPASSEEQAIPDWLQEIKSGTDKPTGGEKDWLKETMPDGEQTNPQSSEADAQPPLEEETDRLLEKVTSLPAVEKKIKKKQGAPEEGEKPLKKAKNEEQTSTESVEKAPKERSPATPPAPAYPDSKKPFHTEDLRHLADIPIISDDETPAIGSTQNADENAPKLPDWLKELEVTVPPEPSVTPSQKKEPEKPVGIESMEKTAQPVNQDENQPFTGGEMPEWLAKLSPPGTFAGENLPGSTFKQEKKDSGSIPEHVESPFPGSNLPEWMTQKPSAQTSPSEPVKAETPETPDLEPAQLPPWMQAMRPIESIVPEHLKTVKPPEEGTGPLAGLSDTLPGLGTVGTYQKPPVLTGKLNVSERQRSHVSVLESLLQPEQKQVEVEQVSQKKNKRTIRTIISLFLVAALFFLVFTGLQVAPQPRYFPNSVTSTYSFFNSLPDDSLILLVIDYDPALSGEMIQASLALIEQLLIKDTRLAVISTNSSGPVLAQDLLSQAQSKHIEYNIPEHVINLGWLPGGASGLQNFARATSLEVQFTWQQGMVGDSSPILRNVLNLQIFRAVLILTDNAETGRLWLEQVQPLLESVPTFMVSSALAGPLLQPYYESKQLQGLISGIEGGMIYSLQTNLPGTASSYWSAYQVGIVLSIAVMLIGGIIQAASRGKRKPKVVAEEKE